MGQTQHIITCKTMDFFTCVLQTAESKSRIENQELSQKSESLKIEKENLTLSLKNLNSLLSNAKEQLQKEKAVNTKLQSDFGWYKK